MLNLEWIGTKHIGGGRLAAGALAAVLMVVGSSVAARAEPLLIGYATWVGYGPLFVAREKGFFADQGLEVTTVRTEETGFPALVDGQVDVIADTLDAAAVWVEQANFEDRPVCFLALDDSVGGDGIVATNDIQKIADLKGKTVAFPELTVSQFYLNVLLHEAGLRAGDVEPVLMTSEDAADAFILGDIDAAVIWEPWLSEAANSARGHLLADSSERPGLIVDCLLTRASTLERRKSDFQALARAWAAAVDYYDAHPEEAIAIMARHVGGWLEDPAVFAETLEGVRFYDRERNRAYFGTPERPRAIYDTAQKAINVWSSLGRVKAEISPADIIGHGIWDQ
jgi:NitT/TauT family transport system substrate-binding protein